jgi:hypothetical protein
MLLVMLAFSYRDCWCVAFGNSFNDDERCVLAGYDNGDVKLFDLRTNKVCNKQGLLLYRSSLWLWLSLAIALQNTVGGEAIYLGWQGCVGTALTTGSEHMQAGLLLLQLRWETNVKNGVCGVAFDRRDIPMNKFMVTCLESVFHVYDARTQNPSKVSSWYGPGRGSNCMRCKG